MKFCEECGTELLDDDIYCTECGMLQEELYEHFINNYCEECGTKIENGDIFCTECGTLQFNRDNNYCEECGTVLEQNNSFCTECGNPIKNYDSEALPISDKLQDDDISDNKAVEKSSYNRNIIMNAVIIVLVVLIISTAVYLFYQLKDNILPSKDEPVSIQTTAESTTETTTEIIEEIDYNLYKTVLEKYQNSEERTEYFLIDLNKDSTYELFVLNSAYEYNSTLDIYTIKNNEALQIGNISMANAYIDLCENGEVYKFYGQMGLGSLTQILLKDDKIELKEIMPEKDYSEEVNPYSDIYNYLESKQEVIYDTADVSDYSLLENIINGIAINTKLISYDSFDDDYEYFDGDYTYEEWTTERITETTTKKSTTTTTEKPKTTQAIETIKAQDIIIPSSPVTLELPGLSYNDNTGFIEITNLNLDGDYSYELNGNIKNTNNKTISHMKLLIKTYDKDGVCIDTDSVLESDMLPDETRKFNVYIYHSDDIKEIKFDIESSYIRFK